MFRIFYFSICTLMKKCDKWPEEKCEKIKIVHTFENGFWDFENIRQINFEKQVTNGSLHARDTIIYLSRSFSTVSAYVNRNNATRPVLRATD